MDICVIPKVIVLGIDIRKTFFTELKSKLEGNILNNLLSITKGICINKCMNAPNTTP